MGFLTAPDDTRIEFLVVATARGKLHVDNGETGENIPKARVFVLEDRTVTVIRPGTGKQKLQWASYAVDTSHYNAVTRQLTVALADGGVLTVDGQNCGCGMGAVGNAGPIDGPYKLTPVRSPEWHSAV